MTEASVIPILRRLSAQSPKVECRTFIVHLPESIVEQLVGSAILALGNIELGYCARRGEVELRCIGTPEAVARAERIVYEKLASHMATTEAPSIEESVLTILRARRQTLAVAESCTGGFLASRITNISGASIAFVEGFVTYANEAKTRSLAVPAALIKEHGAVSAEVARAMAEGAQRAADSNYALSLTGIAGPDGGTADKPVGTVFIGFAGAGASSVERHHFQSDRLTFKLLASQAALTSLLIHLTQDP